jgi:DNA-binding MarR family transcriptional regulator
MGWINSSVISSILPITLFISWLNLTFTRYVYILLIMKNKPSTKQITGTTDYAVECACLNLRMASRFITSLYDEYLRPVRLRVTQFSVLTALEQAGSISITNLSAILLMDRTTLTRDLKPLERQGLVSVSEGDDRRKRNITLSSKGRELLTRALPLWDQAQTHIRTHMGDDRYTALLGQLSEIVKLPRSE